MSNDELAARIDCVNKNVSKILAFLAIDEKRKEEAIEKAVDRLIAYQYYQSEEEKIRRREAPY